MGTNICVCVAKPNQTHCQNITIVCVHQKKKKASTIIAQHIYVYEADATSFVFSVRYKMNKGYYKYTHRHARTHTHSHHESNSAKAKRCNKSLVCILEWNSAPFIQQYSNFMFGFLFLCHFFPFTKLLLAIIFATTFHNCR